jgi:hypothetical protein
MIVTRAEWGRRLWEVKRRMIEARNPLTESVFWFWHARKGGSIERIDFAIDAIDALLHLARMSGSPTEPQARRETSE